MVKDILIAIGSGNVLSCTFKPLSISTLNYCLSGPRNKLQWNRIRPVAQIPPQCTSPISHTAPFCNINMHMCAHFCYKMVHYGIFVWYIIIFVRWVYGKTIIFIIENAFASLIHFCHWSILLTTSKFPALLQRLMGWQPFHFRAVEETPRSCNQKLLAALTVACYFGLMLSVKRAKKCYIRHMSCIDKLFDYFIQNPTVLSTAHFIKKKLTHLESII